MTRILGIDPGSRVMGFGIIEAGASPLCIVFGQLRMTDDELPVRLGKIFVKVQELVQTYRPSGLAIEQVFVHKNANSALKLGQARGAAIAAAIALNVSVYEYAPRQIKQAVVGKGAAEKNQVQHMVKILLKLTEKPGPDAADALGIALCHLHHASTIYKKMSKRKNVRWKNYDRTITR